MPAPIRLAIVGGRRGGSFLPALQAFKDKLTLTAVCDLDEQLLHEWKKRDPELHTTTHFESLIDHSKVDAVLIATPMMLHAKQSIAALKAGKHVISEVIAATTLEECWELVETVEKTVLTYMLSENYCYTRDAMMIRNMTQERLFGELTYAEGAYIHDCRYLLYNPDGSRTWRGSLHGAQMGRCNGYPTHSLGPIAQWLNITRGDDFLRTTTFVSRSAARQEYAQALLGNDHPDALDENWAVASDSASTLIETKLGRVISLRMDSASPRPHQMNHYGLQGSRGAYVSPRTGGEQPLVWIEGMSKGSGMPGSKDHPSWQPLHDLAEKYEHPRWKKHGDTAKKAGHGGGDFFVLEDFADAILQKRLPPIDVYDAVTWSCITPLSAINVKSNGIPLDVPDFLRGKRRPE